MPGLWEATCCAISNGAGKSAGSNSTRVRSASIAEKEAPITNSRLVIDCLTLRAGSGSLWRNASLGIFGKSRAGDEILLIQARAHYSNRSAARGLSRDAFLAGPTPKATPTKTATPKAIGSAVLGMTNGT